jgi:RNAse (barnase) inhibitor barstar
MNYKTVKIDMRQMLDWDSFHDTFRKEMVFPSFYGKNMNA